LSRSAANGLNAAGRLTTPALRPRIVPERGFCFSGAGLAGAAPVLAYREAGPEMAATRRKPEMKYCRIPMLCVLLLAAAEAAWSADILATVTGDRVRVRALPSVEGDILTHLDAGERVTVLATPLDHAPWVQIRLHRQDAAGHRLTGWLHGRYLRVGVPSEQELSAVPPNYQTVMLLASVPGLPGGGEGAVVATVQFDPMENGGLRARIREMACTQRDPRTGVWSAPRVAAVIPFRTPDGHVWQDADGGAWAVGDTFLLSPVALWRRVAAVPGRSETDQMKALNALGGALAALGEAERVEDTWVVDPPAVPFDPGPGHQPIGPEPLRLFKPL
jgi:hypothetical protein